MYTICNLPSNYPGITFDEKGVCSICKKKEKEKQIQYKKELIN